MKKMNKKGFTLIEMLVVIAIIAVLVAIIIPTVTSATDKAAAAANAANLRSMKAEITTAMLTGELTLTDSNATDNAAEDVTTACSAYTDVTMKNVASYGGTDAIKVEYNAQGKVVTVKYQDMTIAEWAAKAEGSAAAASTPSAP